MRKRQPSPVAERYRTYQKRIKGRTFILVPLLDDNSLFVGEIIKLKDQNGHLLSVKNEGELQSLVDRGKI